MIIGVPKETKNNEYRVALSVNGAKTLVQQKHQVLIEEDAGVGSRYSNQHFFNTGAEVVSRDELYRRSELIYKVKEPSVDDFKYLREGLIVITYLHSNAHRDQIDAFLTSKAIGIAYEDVTDEEGGFPLLKPMSRIAGMGGFLAALQYSQAIHKGRGIMLARIPGAIVPEITIIGAGTSGLAAAGLAASFGNKVTILDTDLNKLEKAKNILPPNTELLFSDETNLTHCLKRSDILINCVLWPKWRKDHLVSIEMLKLMKPQAMIVDVSCDEHGAIESSRSTSHDEPIYTEGGVIHYCVDNIPGAFPRTASDLLCNSTLPYVLEIANKGCQKALKENRFLRRGLTYYNGELTLAETGQKHSIPYKTPEHVLGMLEKATI